MVSINWSQLLGLWLTRASELSSFLECPNWLRKWAVGIIQSSCDYKVWKLQDAVGTPADVPDNPAILAVKKLCEVFPHLLLACDVCLCPYTDHGHCGEDPTTCHTELVIALYSVLLNMQVF